jgi:hypothetical protein
MDVDLQQRTTTQRAGAYATGEIFGKAPGPWRFSNAAERRKFNQLFPNITVATLGKLSTGLDCGLSFGKELLKHIPDSISVLIIPTAVGGSSISQWINDSTFRNVTLLTNFKEKIEIGKKYGTIKGILWHQGENDATEQETIEIYNKQLQKLFTLFRNSIGNSELPILIGELGSFSKTDDNWQAINSKIEGYVKTDPNSYLIKTNDLKDKGDRVHFDSEGQREIGKRFAERFIKRQE